eukprot:gene433-458_t
MQVTWSSLPENCTSGIISNLAKYAPSLTRQELANVIWDLGKLGVRWSGNYSPDLRYVLFDRLSSILPTFSQFDIESVFVGFTASQVTIEHIPSSLWSAILTQVEVLLPTLNIFHLHHILVGLASAGYRVGEPGGNNAPIGQALYMMSVERLHTFLPPQLGEVVWALGCMGVSDDLALTGSESSSRDRVLAVLSRSFNKLPVRGAAYALWGLAQMRLRWSTLEVGYRATPDGRFISPLSVTVFSFLGHRTGAMREHEYSIAVLSLGLLGLNWFDIPVTVKAKLERRITRVTPFMTSRSAAYTTWGLGRLGSRWPDLLEDTKRELCYVLAGPRGVGSMSAAELSLVLSGLGLMDAKWFELSSPLREALRQTLTTILSASNCTFSPFARGSILWSLRKLGTPPDFVGYRLGSVTAMLNRPTAGVAGSGIGGDSDGVSQYSGIGVTLQRLLSKGVTWGALTEQLQVEIMKRVRDVCGHRFAGTRFEHLFAEEEEDGDDAASTVCLASLGELGVQWDELR